MHSLGSATVEGALPYLVGKGFQSASALVVLGSGLGPVAAYVLPIASARYCDVPGFPVPTAEGHAGILLYGRLASKDILLMQGRCHLYEGLSPVRLIFPLRVARMLGAKTLILSNAAGSLNTNLRPGDLMLVADHIDLTGRAPLRGWHGAPVDLSGCYSRRLGELALSAALEKGIDLKRGVLAAMLGPTYETPAEVGMLRRLGADAVTMSTIPETIAGSALGMEVLGISCISNIATGLDGSRPDHQRVLATVGEASWKFLSLAAEVLQRRFPVDIRMRV